MIDLIALLLFTGLSTVIAWRWAFGALKAREYRQADRRMYIAFVASFIFATVIAISIMRWELHISEQECKCTLPRTGWALFND